MRVLVAGASGAVGSRMLQPLAAAGHTVIGLSASLSEAPRRVPWVAADALDREQLTDAVVRSAPDVVVHQLTRLPRRLRGDGVAEAFAANDRLRRTGTENLVAASQAAGVKRLVAQSIALAYAPEGPMVVDETARLWTDAPEPWSETVAAVARLEELVLSTAGLSGVVLRYGTLYGPGTWWAADGDLTNEVRAGRMPLVGRATGVTSFVHVDDAAAAACAAISAPSGVYNIVDNDPAPAATWLPALARGLGAPPPPPIDERAAGARLGWLDVHRQISQRGASNARARAVLGFQPSHPTWRHHLGRAPSVDGAVERA